ncbi:MAG TPA: hypothetical protein VHE34_25910 [Puia sp.]|uniref:hypothetical protein n=1 Tax=Puia sp. TaxID=2045100 RepID=UPI002BCC94D9|nr:hypothetical protein [Puia sp.]HVU98695.1 hypothetical protein [Puia sp.]
MRRGQFVFWILALGMLLQACRKDHTPPPTVPPTPKPARKVLLKDIVIPSLPSPYYHFEYNSDSLATKVDFASGYSTYDVLYKGNNIAEMRNNIIVNHDTLRYLYDDAGKVFMIIFINQSNVVYRHVIFLYEGDLVKKIDFDHKVGDVGFLIDRNLTFAYYDDGNVKTITDHRPGFDGSPENTSVRQFEAYDNKVNVDDFSLIHATYQDHLFLFQGFRLQKNNPGREIFSAGPDNLAYTEDYTYTYNSDGTPLVKSGSLLFTAGSDSGKRFQTTTNYTYY